MESVLAISHVWTNTVKVPGLSTLPADAPVTIVGASAVDVETAVAAGATVEVDVGTINIAKVVSLVMHSDQVNVTVNTNAVDGSGGQSFALGAAKGFGWNNALPNPNPVTIDINKFFVTNTGAKATTFRAGFLLS
jgi:hypothetical protein